MSVASAKARVPDGGSTHVDPPLTRFHGSTGGKQFDPTAEFICAYLLKTQLFNFLGNMGYMSVKD